MADLGDGAPTGVYGRARANANHTFDIVNGAEQWDCATKRLVSDRTIMETYSTHFTAVAGSPNSLTVVHQSADR